MVPQAKSAIPAVALFALLLVNPAGNAFAFWGLLGKIGGAVGKTGGATAGKAAAGTVGKGAVVVGAERAAAGTAGEGAGAAANLGQDAARGAKAGGVADAAVTANAALPPEVARYLSKPASALTAADTADMMSMYHKMIQQAGKSGDFTIVERLPSTANQGKTLSNSGSVVKTAETTAPAKAPAKAAAQTGEVPLHAVQLLLHAAKGGDHAARAELNQRCTTFRRQGSTPKNWQQACAA
jgi:hypothetical protein